MSSAIGFREFREDEYGKFIRTLSDEELMKAGERLRILCGDVVTPTSERIRQTVENLPGRISAQISEMIHPLSISEPTTPTRHPASD